MEKKKEKPIVRRCQNIVREGYYAGDEKICNKIVHSPNKFFCSKCLRKIEDVNQALGYMS